jgi:hypothetical protein
MKMDIRDDCQAVTYIMENGLIQASDYEEPDEAGLEMPNGNSAN